MYTEDENEIGYLERIDNESTVELSDDVKRDIQYLLIMRLSALENRYSDAWKQDKWFVELCKKYGFNKTNIYKGFEEMCK